MFGDYIDITELIALYVDMLQICLPITLFFGVSNIVINMFTNAFFNGKLRMGGRF